MSVKLTEFGICVRKLRLVNGEYLKDMAEKLDITPTYLSAVERGQRNAPHGWASILTKIYKLSKEESFEMVKAISESRYTDKIDISHLSFDDKRLVTSIAKGLPDMENREILEEIVKDL